MKVWKFGGTSVGKPERMHSVAQLITQDGARKIVVLSAVSGTTNSLVEIGGFLYKQEKPAAIQVIDRLHQSYKDFIIHLYASEAGKQKGSEIITRHFDFIRALAHQDFTSKQEKELLAEGELISTQLFQAYLEEIEVKSALLPALDFMRIDADDEPNYEFTERALAQLLAQHADATILLTQGYICRNPEGEVDNLKRGGSDYSASLIGAAARAEEIQIWTDIDGMHNNDPRIVKNTFPIAELSFDEAAELAYFGAKILHPFSIRPAKRYNIPVRLLNTMEPSARGTLITNQTAIGAEGDVKAIAAKDGIIAIKIQSSRMLLAHGFLRRVFEVFEKYKTPIDMITTSEVAVSLTIDNSAHLDEIVQEIGAFGTVEVDKDQTIVCVVGNLGFDKQGLALAIFHSLREIPLRMISYGGSDHNVSILIHTSQKNQALNALNEGLFTFENA
ncbi:MAG: aspartate kinase [Bacteroidota bacterium]